MLLTHSFDSFEIIKKFSTWTVVQYKTNKIMCFETVIQFDNERMIQH